MAIAALIALAPSLARGDTVALKVNPGVAECSDSRTIAKGVAERLGYWPFRPNATRAIEVGIVREKTGLKASLLITQNDLIDGERTIESPSDDCDELSEALELAIAIAIDPLHGLATASPPQAMPAPPPPVSAAPAPSPAPSPPAMLTAPPLPPPVETFSEAPSTTAAAKSEGSPYRQTQLALGLLVHTGLLPNQGAGLVAQLRFEKRALVFGFQGRFIPPTEEDIGGLRVRGALVQSGGFFCGRRGRFDFCGLSGLGIIRASAEMDGNLLDEISDPYLSVGGRLTFRQPLTESIFALLNAQIEAPIPVKLSIFGETLWRNQPIAGVFSAQLGWAL
jgi:hypothetical protein